MIKTKETMERIWIAEIKPWVPLVFILLVAAFLRGLFYSGINDLGDLANVARASQAVAFIKESSQSFGEGLQQVRIILGGWSDLLFALPHLATFYIFGTSKLGISAPSILYSLVNIGLVYLIASHITKERSSGLFTALVFCFMPFDIFFSTSAPLIEFAMLLVLLGVWCVLLVGKGNIWPLLILCGSVVGILLIEPSLLIIFAGLLLFRFIKRIPRIVKFAILGFGLVLSVWHSIDLSVVFVEFYRVLQAQPESLLLIPLLLVAGSFALLRKQPGSIAIFVLMFAALTAFLVSKLVRPDEVVDVFTTGVYILSLLAFASMLVGSYVSFLFGKHSVGKLVSFISLLGAIAAGAAVSGANQFLPSLENLDWLGMHSLFLVYAILSGFAFFGILFSPLLVDSGNGFRSHLTVGLLSAILLSNLSFSWQRTTDFAYKANATEIASESILRGELDQPIMTLTEETALRVALQLGKRIDVFSSIEEPLPPTIQILTFEDELSSPPSNWLKVGVFGRLGKSRLVLYSVLSSIETISFLNLARVSTDFTDDTMYSSRLIAGDSCSAVTAWREHSEGVDHLSIIEYDQDLNCVGNLENLVSLETLSNPENIQGYIHFPGSSLQDHGWLDIEQISSPVYDMRTVSVEVLLVPNTTYLYSIEVKSQSPTATLYWQALAEEGYLELKRYPDWTRVAVLIATPNWDGPKNVLLSPVLFSHANVVSVRNFVVGEVK